jgi:RNA polymerase sigma-70 factor, ECF subfamily
VLDDATIERFVREDYARVVKAVAFVTGDPSGAEDAVQEAVARAWLHKQPIDALPAWVASVALNVSRSGWRRIGAERRAIERLQAPSAPGEPDPDEVDLRRAMATLPRRQREVAVLRYLLQFDTKETAAALRVSEGTVKNSLSKARDALAARLLLSEEVPDADDR